MKKYVEESMRLSRQQLMKLAKGKKIRVKKDDMMGDVKIYLTSQQAKKVATRRRKGLGIDLMLDQAQINHNIKFGGGFWDSFKRFLGRAASVVNENVVQPVMRGLMPAISQAKDRIITRGVNIGQDLVEGGLRRIGAGQKCTCQVVKAEKPLKKQLPEGLRKYMEEKRKMKAVQGKGFFDDVFRPVAGKAVESGLTYAAPKLGKVISGKGMRVPRKTMGASFRLNKGL